jgi:tRNA-dihydrouridine synthase A
MIDHTFCVAPMMDWTDRHDRVFLRQFSTHTLLYTEMVTSAALIHGDAGYLLHHDASEQPVAIQLGGSNPEELARAASLAETAGYCEINLNVGCPSDRVQSGAFGACLMADPALVARCITAINEAVALPVTVKCRTGIDDRDSEQELADFVATVAEAGCDIFIIHARKAILSGLSPKQNREIPELDYARVFKIKALFPELEVILNGGISTLDSSEELLQSVDGIMIGREAYKNPYILHQVDSRIFGEKPSSNTRLDYLNQYLKYIEAELERGTPLHHMTRHILGLFKGQVGGKQFRRHLSENSHRKDAGLNLVLDAMAYVS